MKNLSVAQELEQSKVGNIILRYSLPAILSGLVASLYNMVDQVFIGNIIGTAGNAATNVVYPLTTLNVAIMLLLGLGGIIAYSITLGRGDLVQAKKLIGVTTIVPFFAGILVTLVTLVFTQPLLMLFGATESSYELAYTYVRITAVGFPLLMVTESVTKAIRADGSPRYAMICSITGALLNCGLNPLFMIVFNMGIAGAAWATVLGQVISFVLAIRYLRHFKTFEIKLKEIIPDFASIRKALSLGAAPLFNQLTMMATQIVLNNVLVFYGALSIYGTEIPLACAGIITKVSAIYNAVMVGIAQGAQPLIGYSYGSNKPQKVLEIYFTCVKIACIISVIVFLIFQIFPYQILTMFGADSELYFEFGVSYFKIFLLMTFLNGIQPISFNFFTSIGKPIHSTVISLSKQLILLIPLMLILPRFLGVNGVLYAGPVADLAAFIITIAFLRKEIRNLRSRIPQAS